MSRYIDAEAIDNRIKAEWAKQEDDKGYGLAHFFVETQPTVDVAPVVHGHWQDKVMQIGIPKYHYIVCPECSSGYNIVYVHLLLGDGKLFNRCPECGAKMDEDGDDE